MTDLVPIQHPVPVDAEEAITGSEDEALLERIEDVRRERKKAEERLSAVGKRMSFMQSVLVKETRDLSDQMKQLRDEVEALQREITDGIRENAEANKATWEPDDLDAEFAEYDYSRQDAEFEDPVFFSRVEEVEESPELVKLFRKISMKTHPDRTDDPEKHALFISAKECRRQGDLEGLKDIWNLLQNAGSRLLNKLMKRLEAERQELQNLRNQLSILESGVDFQLLIAFERNPGVVINATRDQLSGKIETVRLHRDLLLRSLGREKVVRSTFKLGY